MADEFVTIEYNGIKYQVRKEIYESRRSAVEKAIATGVDPSRIVQQFTRIVGYYAFTSAWNGSKLEERKARHRGNYQVAPSVTSRMAAG